MKRKNDELTFMGALAGDWSTFKGYWRSGQLFYELLDDSGYSNGPGVIAYLLAGLWIVLATVGVVLAWTISVSYLTCGLSLLILAGVLPALVTGLLLRYMIFKADQYKKSEGA